MPHIQDRWHRKDRTRTTRYGKGLRWQVEWVDAQGHKRKRSFELRDLAEDFLTELRHEQKRGIYRGPSTAMTVDELFEAWVQSNPNRAKTTIVTIRGQYKRAFHEPVGRLPAHQVTRSQLQQAVNAALLTYAPNTVRNTCGQVGSAFKWAASEDLIPRNPWQGIRLPKAPQKIIEPITREQVLTIAENIRPLAMQTMVRVAATTGLRVSELRGLTWSRVKGATLLVDRQLSEDGGEFLPLKTPASLRKISIDPETLASLRALRDVIGEGRGGLVFHHDGHAYKLGSMTSAWHLMRERTGLTVRGWHQLRHYHASHLIQAGFSPVAVARRLGHRDATETLRTYAHMWPSDDVAMAAASALTLPTPSEKPALRVVSG